MSAPFVWSRKKLVALAGIATAGVLLAFVSPASIVGAVAIGLAVGGSSLWWHERGVEDGLDRALQSMRRRVELGDGCRRVVIAPAPESRDEQGKVGL